MGENGECFIFRMCPSFINVSRSYLISFTYINKLISLTVGSSYYDVFVTNSVSNELSDFNKCKTIYVYKGSEFKGSVDCSKTLTGDQIVVQIASTSGYLLVYEVEVYRKLFPSEVYSKHCKLYGRC